MKPFTSGKTALALAGIFLAAIVSCNTKSKDNTDEQTAALVRDCEEVAAMYRDSIKLAKDSATVLRLSDAMDEALTKVNYKYAPDLYLNISESQNGKIAALTLRAVELRDSVLYSFAHPQRVLSDSVGKDHTMSNKPDTLLN